MVTSNWKPNRRVSPVDQRLAAELHLRQIATIIRSEKIADAVDRQINALVDQMFAVLQTTRPAWERLRAMADLLRRIVPTGLVALHDQLRGLVGWSHTELVSAYATAVPRAWFRVAAPQLAAVESSPHEPSADDGTRQVPPTLILEAKHARRQGDGSNPQPQPQGGGRRRGGGGRATATATVPPSPPQPLLTPDAIILPGQDVGPLQGNPLRADSYTEPIARRGAAGLRYTDAEWQQVLQQVVFPPPSGQEVEAILQTPVNGQTWQQRFTGLSKLMTSPDAVAQELVSGFAAGEAVEAMRRRVQPLVQGIQASARRIARTEGCRIAETVQRRSWGQIGDMMRGAQILAVLDQNTRPEHAARNGKVFFNSAADGEPTIDQLPSLPDAPNCRCWSTPVLKPPKEFDADPAVKAAFANDQGAGIPDPATYDQWFAQADEPSRKLAVGTRRYHAMRDILAGQREPEWTDFIDADGTLLPVADLKAERPLDRVARKMAVQGTILERRRLLSEVNAKQFLTELTPRESMSFRRRRTNVRTSYPLASDASPVVAAKLQELTGTRAVLFLDADYDKLPAEDREPRKASDAQLILQTIEDAYQRFPKISALHRLQPLEQLLIGTEPFEYAPGKWAVGQHLAARNEIRIARVLDKTDASPLQIGTERLFVSGGNDHTVRHEMGHRTLTLLERADADAIAEWMQIVLKIDLAHNGTWDGRGREDRLFGIRRALSLDAGLNLGESFAEALSAWVHPQYGRQGGRLQKTIVSFFEKHFAE